MENETQENDARNSITNHKDVICDGIMIPELSPPPFFFQSL